jgi:hypothetical protein
VPVEAEARRPLDGDDGRLPAILEELLEAAVADLALTEHQREKGARTARGGEGPPVA